jgi:hypothetical protein
MGEESLVPGQELNLDRGPIYPISLWGFSEGDARVPIVGDCSNQSS